MRYSGRSARNLTRFVPALDAPAADSFRRDATLIGLISFVHGLSHFYQLALAPLFPLIKAEFDVSWSLLGSLVGVFYVVSGISQFTCGFLVDRFGARPVLFGGLALMAGGALAAGLAPGFIWLFPVAAALGAGNGVFHPADFAIINANVAQRRLGHAYSSHGIGGNLGYAAAPIVVYGLGSAFGWRVSLVAVGLVGLTVLGVVATQRGLLECHRSRARGAAPQGGALALFLQPAILACFAYFATNTMGSLGLQTFAPSVLNVAFDVPLAIATSTLTAYLLGGTAGIFAGGFLATHAKRHDLVAAAELAIAAGLLVLVTVMPPPAALLLPLFAAVGFSSGATGPSRDLIVRSAAPAGAVGRVYGFVYSGLDVGGTLGPILFGFMLDHAMGRSVFLAVAVCYTLAIATVVQVRRVRPAHA